MAALSRRAFGQGRSVLNMKELVIDILLPYGGGGGRGEQDRCHHSGNGQSCYSLFTLCHFLFLTVRDDSCDSSAATHISFIDEKKEKTSRGNSGVMPSSVHSSATLVSFWPIEAITSRSLPSSCRAPAVAVRGTGACHTRLGPLDDQFPLNSAKVAETVKDRAPYLIHGFPISEME